MTLRRYNNGQLGFNVHNEGMVVDVEQNGLAQVAGLRQSSRLVEVCKISGSATIGPLAGIKPAIPVQHSNN